MNPGVDVCERNCRARPWEPHKYASAEAQDRNLAMLLEWVRSYPTRDDACSLVSHRRLFDAFDGLKREVGAGQETAMDDAGLQAQIAGARAYDALFVASLTGVFAPIVADAAAIAAGDRVLDVACGTGVLAREAAATRAPLAESVVGLDMQSRHAGRGSRALVDRSRGARARPKRCRSPTAPSTRSSASSG